MTWLLWLYPAGWRRRYGDEFLALIEDRGWSTSVLIDVLRGAFDARLHPELSNVPAEAIAGPSRSRPDRFDKFTRRSKNVLHLAQTEAQRLHHPRIGNEHLLLGLLIEREGLAAHILADYGVEADELLSRMQQAPGAEIHALGLTPQAKRTIELSVNEANRLRHRFLGTEHLLLGLVVQREGLAAQVLREHEVPGVEELRRHVLKLLNEGPA